MTEMINKFSKNKATIEDNVLVDDMIKKELLVKQAKKAGIQVSAEEVSNLIKRERAAIDNTNYLDENTETVKEIMKNRIRITGLSEDDFWNSNEIKTEYEKAILSGKLYDQLTQQGKIKSIQEFENFKDDLLNKSKSSLTINTLQN
ncbi:SurA N-terminal domain-containing protein [Paenibacillus qinlingensis]|uniref:Peptidylprolyl isomerase n=1 Tax=Paenibacillus qinlingensis TaxID=1837343 RepID=A0ABU1NTX9_9BACL|nr:SurA N-terminal domain-containing protein [Paenibacillus qinlingensis]MDR6550938.1 hypothetical protein [Paenibacillus qinlingensis]